MQVRALERLHALGLLDADARLSSDVGLLLAGLPLEPALGRCLLAAARRAQQQEGGGGSCGEEALVCVAMLSLPSVWVTVAGSGRALDDMKARFAAAEGDLVTYLNVFRAWQGAGKSGKWAAAHMLNQHSLLKATDIAGQLVGLLKRLGIAIHAPSPPGAAAAAAAATTPAGTRDVEPLCRAITEGLFLNAAVFDHTEYNPLAPEGDPGTNVYRLVRHTDPCISLKLRLHKSSVMALRQPPPQWVVFAGVQQGDSGWYEMQSVTEVKPQWLVEAAPHVYRKELPRALRA